MSDWGKGTLNNTIGWGQGACNNTINWGKSQKDSSVAASWSGDTDISGCSGAGGLAQVNNVYSMSFDGASDFILLDNSNDTLNVDYLTISIWFKPNVAEFSAIIGNRYFNAGWMSWTIQTFSNGKVRYSQRSPNLGTSFNTIDTYNVGEWNHIAVTYDSNGAKMYLNGGTPVVNTSQTNPIAYSPDFVSDNVTIGSAPAGGSTSSPTGPTQHFNGLIDEVAIFNTALTEAEILSIYNATAVVGGVNKTADLSELTTPPVAWYRMGD